MASWESLLGPGTIDWLLEPENSSVRFITLTDLLDADPSDAETRRARSDIMRKGVVPAILERQIDGAWNGPGRFYRDKYTGTVWQLIILAEHLAEGADSRIRAACEYLLAASQEPEAGGFSFDASARSGGGLPSGVVPCLTGNMVFSLIRLGYIADARLARAVEWIARYQRFDDGTDAPPAGPPYDRYEMCWGRHTCHMGVVKALKALAEIPQERRTPEVEKTLHAGTDYLLAHHIFRKSHSLTEVARPGWLRLQFPLMYQSDILEVALILAGLGCRDERMEEAVEKIAAKRGADGRWSLEATFNRRFQVDIEAKGKPSKWITLRALRLLKKFYA
jgi:hypothetical protein